MTQMERLAEAIARGRSESGRKLFNGWDSMDRWEKEMWLSAARYALAEIRSWDTAHLDHDGQQGFYSMIDAALV